MVVVVALVVALWTVNPKVLSSTPSARWAFCVSPYCLKVGEQFPMTYLGFLDFIKTKILKIIRFMNKFP